MKSLEELKAIREKMQGKVGMRSEDSGQTRVIVGMATCGIASGARPVLNVLSDEVQKRGMSNVVVTQTGCMVCASMSRSLRCLNQAKKK